MKKKKFLNKFLSLILMVPILFIAGCKSGGGGIQVPDPNDTDLPIGVDFDGLTHTYNDYPFIGAYIFVDPGSQGIFTDGYDGDKDVTFAQLVERQYETLAKELTYRLFSVYGNDYITAPESNKQISFGDTSHKIGIAKNQIIDDNVFVLGAPTLALDGENATTTWSYLLGFIDTTVSGKEGDLLNEIRNGKPFDLTNAFVGGNTPKVVDSKIAFDNTTHVGAASWVTTFALNAHFENVEEIVLQKLLESIVGVQDNKQALINSIDHLGFVQEDYIKILECINRDIIGDGALQYDLESRNALSDTILTTGVNFKTLVEGNLTGTLKDKWMAVADEIISNVENIDVSYECFLSEDELSDMKTGTFNNKYNVDVNSYNNWLRAHEYKGYDVIIPSIVQSAIGATIDETGFVESVNKEVGEGVNIYSTLPRAQVLYMDIYTLQGTSKEEVENSQEESENPNGEPNEELGEIEYDENVDYVKLEKYLPDMNIISIVLLPNEVTGNPNKMVNGEIVPDETVTVDGFLLGSIDFAISGESGYNSTIYADFELKAKGNLVKDGENNFRSDSVEIYGDRIPENDDEAAFNVYTDLLPMDELKEDSSKKNDYLIGGYNGSKVEDYNLKSFKATTGNDGDYYVYSLKSNTDFVTYGDNGIEFDGGENYVKINFIFTEIFYESDASKTNNIVNMKVNTLLNLLAFNPEVL